MLPAELSSYLKNNFLASNPKSDSFAIKQDNFWDDFDASKNDVFFKLKSCFPQLNFPIIANIDKEENYRKAVLKGNFKDIGLFHNNLLENGENISFELYESFSGKIPVVIIPNENDFISMIQALLYKNNPVDIPKSMGASLLNGINNWGRIHQIQNHWSPTEEFSSWQEYFKNKVLPFPSLYQDRIILLSRKPYSNVSSATMQMSKNSWLDVSHKIRLEHECTHLYTLQRFGIASNNLHDELIADYVGIVKALGVFKKEWLYVFMGIEDYPSYRKGGRLQNYIKTIEVESEEFRVLIDIIKKSIDNISAFDALLNHTPTNEEIKIRIDTLCSISLFEVSSSSGTLHLLEKYNKLKTAITVASY